MIDSTILLLLLLCCVCISNASRQACHSPRFSCRFNNPCSPRCNAGQDTYPGPSGHVYIECIGDRCTEQRCPRRTTWNQAAERCETASGLEYRCAFGTFDCAERNPCTPTLCESGQMNYPGPSPRRYVTCAGDGSCTEGQCQRTWVWVQERERCVGTRNNPGPPRCRHADFDCDSKNPCVPFLCTPERTRYANVDSTKYIKCGPRGGCRTKTCPVGLTFDDEAARCRRS